MEGGGKAAKGALKGVEANSPLVVPFLAGHDRGDLVNSVATLGVEKQEEDQGEVGARNPTNPPHAHCITGEKEANCLYAAMKSDKSSKLMGKHADYRDFNPPFHAVFIEETGEDNTQLEDKEEKQRKELFRWRKEASKPSIASFVRLVLSLPPHDTAPTC
ncbi:unnamed protein product [Phytomonas sp. Hart1]|nr:unnamed protein product [Phytomonas sp. Hart1]|eukprot:CCW66663.1 unnamed protein product [Phytomonas sp. isolate Hart1]